MIRTRYILLVVIAIAFGGCNPGIVQPPPSTVTDASAYFFQKNQSVSFEDSILYPTRSGSTISIIFVNDSANTYSIKESNSESLTCNTGTDAVSISGITTHSIIPLPSGFSIQSMRDSIPVSIPLPINHVIANSKIIVASNDSTGVYYLPIGSQNWTQSKSLLGKTNSVTAFALKGDTIFAGTSSGTLYYSIDGAIWQQSGKYPQGILALASSTAALYISDGDSVYRNEHPGSSAIGIALTSKLGIRYISSLAIIDTGGGIAEIVVGGTSSQGLYYRNGITGDWTKASLSASNIREIIATSSPRFYCTTAGSTSAGGIYSSEDGITWTQRDTLKSALLAYSSGKIIASNQSGIVRAISDNSISSGAPLSGLIPGPVTDLSASGSDYIAATTQGVYISTNGGTSWNLSSNGISSQQFKYTETPGEVILLHSISSTSTDSSWTACMMAPYQKNAIPITGRILGHLDSLSINGKFYPDVIQAQYGYEQGGLLITSIPYMQIFYAKNQGPVLIYQFANPANMTLPSQKIYRNN